MDINKREIAILLPIILFIVWIGVFPKTFLRVSAPVAKHTVEQLELVKLGEQIQYSQLHSH
jgi:NADH-quinone oxidoreductase subunit M